MKTLRRCCFQGAGRTWHGKGGQQHGLRKRSTQGETLHNTRAQAAHLQRGKDDDAHICSTDEKLRQVRERDEEGEIGAERGCGRQRGVQLTRVRHTGKRVIREDEATSKGRMGSGRLLAVGKETIGGRRARRKCSRAVGGRDGGKV